MVCNLTYIQCFQFIAVAMLIICINVIYFGEIFFFLFLNKATNKVFHFYFKLSLKNCYICYCRYDDILINGLPDWRQPVFYYRRVRKMSNAELALLLFIILTVGHYAVVWSIYLEKQLVSIGNKSNDPSLLNFIWNFKHLFFN